MDHEKNIITIQYLTRMIVLASACVDLARSMGLL